MELDQDLADPVAVIVTLQGYQAKLSSQVETLKQDMNTCREFQRKYGTGSWKTSLASLQKSLSARANLLKEVRFQLDLVAAQVRQGRGLCHKLNKLIGPPVASINMSAGMS
mmetsp:Transcript_24101/g.59445  ORF Transcript_24101/g.59445 Transcript_24101/m.59445 type:complete len:111 (+) Transcript_24101:33-365(+)|eukprot:CAMPEP_0206217986 /NCGR_PEP_ID=MMETSP0047_2-20121206/3561_1 /ASSEMBLY_ACC=CAM_ASM_000192 /TAXON_ID=195065 /ORGANISM="Chroomonas mesostigmatica_cf, Strain CCMP1168" /LENGTH=110 /DNA_ID=CAMNT_0053640465 /DNA_START=26 /DNA_END=358 /DNA_ORIENTATION=+